MRMKNRYCRMGKSLLGAMCLLSTCGVTYSCSDDMDLEESKPSFLGGSIYDELKASGKYTNVVRLIDDLEYADVLSKTGSKTLFVADDEAYAKFYRNNSWNVSSYEQLTPGMKRILLNGAMLNNAYVMEMLVNTSGGGKNLCLRQTTAATAVDTIPYWSYSDLPNNLNHMDEAGNALPVDEESTERIDTKFWKKFRDRGPGSGIYMALDATQPMMTHFLEGQLRDKNIENRDVAFILNKRDESWEGNRSYIYGNRVVEQDVTCLNGYFHVLDSVLLTPPNMAEMIRQNGTDDAYRKDKSESTKYFSLLLDRFSAPYYNATLTRNYKALYNIPADSIYQKRYLSNFSQGGRLASDPDGESLGDFPYLSFDPGWNELAASSTTVKESDMSAIFAPSDQAMEDYFINGGGRTLMDRYALKSNTPENLAYNLYQVPLDIIQALLNNLLKDSFNESVPSKYLTIMNDAQDQMFNTFENEEAYKANIKKCLLANNGVVYVMNGVIAPADYAAVLAPVLYSKNTQIVKTVVRADDNYIDGTEYNNAPLQMYYSTYLKAMQSRFSFFVPTDDALGKYGYVDPYSYSLNSDRVVANRRYMKFNFDENTGSTGKRIAVNMQAYDLDEMKGPQDNDVSKGTTYRSRGNADITSGWGLVKKKLLTEMIDQHIVVHDNDDVQGVDAPQQYYLSRSGAPVFVESKGNASEYGKGMKVKGGYQLMLDADAYPENDHVCTVEEGYNQTRDLPANNHYGNGMTYFLDRPMQPTMKTVYNRLAHEDNFAEFFNLCAAYDDNDDPVEIESLLEAAGLKTKDMTESDWTNEVNKYRIFTDADGYIAPRDEMLVRFFNNYRYTIYVPTNDALRNAIANGLPTWGDIYTFVEDNKGHRCELCDEEVEVGEDVLCEHNQKKAQAMMTMLVNFLKYHFQDESLFVDNVESNESYQTSCIDNVENIYLSLTATQTNGHLAVTDNNNGTCQVVSDPALHNVLAREMNFDSTVSPLSPTGYGTVKVSSYVVLHQIDGVLNFLKLENGRYDSQWATPAKAKAFVAKYRIRK